MKLYHAAILVFLLFLAACSSPVATQEQLIVTLAADGKDLPVQLPAGSTVQQALEMAGVKLGNLDRVTPPAYTLLSAGSTIRVTRVTEEFEVTQVVIPFEHQTLRNESLAKDKEVLLQQGRNGLQEITNRRVYENGIEISTAPVKSTITQEPVPEIVMIGVQSPFAPLAVPGKLVYLRDGNAWMIESTTSNRRPLVTSGDLDGRVLSLSPDQQWLLFTRRLKDPDQINRLWVMDLAGKAGEIDLKINNIIHFADWLPGSNTKVVFSTVEPRPAAPGWQANNDLYLLNFSSSGWVSKWKDKPVLEPNSGGVYGWWGTQFIWSPGGENMAYTRPDSVGVVDFELGILTPTLQLTPLQTRGDWAWAPGLSWGPDGKALYTVDHVAPPGSTSPEESPQFDLAAVPLVAGAPVHLVSQVGMFAYPLASPYQNDPGGEIEYQIAYLQAVFPTQSESSRYRLAIIDRDGSNRRVIFPAEGAPSLAPQVDWGAWSPAKLPESSNFALAVIYEGNLWLVDTATAQAQQITGDGLTSRVIWR